MPRASRWSNVDRLLGFERHGHRRHDRFHEEEEALLARYHGPVDAAISPKEVTKVCLRLRHLIQEVVPCEMDTGLVTAPHSRIITPAVVRAATDAGGEQYKGCVVYGLLVNLGWFQQEATVELWDSGLHKLRAEACGVIAKLIIEGEENTSYLLHALLLHRYSHLVRGVPDRATNVIEKAVDLHAVRIIGSSGYQKCIGYLWRGWVVQDEDDPSFFVDYTDKDNTNFLVHMDPNRMRTPRNQNAAQILFSVIYLGLYTLAINTVNPTGVLDAGEILLYVFTLGFVCDELTKVYKVGTRILGFWNVFNGVLYSFLSVSLAFRVVGLSFGTDTDGREYYSTLSYNMLAFIAPMFWCRLLLYLDSFKFFGTMLVVLKVMLKESVIFFALLAFIIVGFLQAFVGLDLAEDNRTTDTSTVIQYMIKVVLSSPELDGFDHFGAPWGTILYYCYTFIVMTILLNILIALYNSAYSDTLDNADDEYLALFAQRTMQFVRAPDENVYVAPLNLIEIAVSASSEWWMGKRAYQLINDCVMTVLYSPLLVITAWYETRTAHVIRHNRARGEEDDDVVNEWEQLEGELDLVAEGWAKSCDAVKPNLEDDPVLSQVKALQGEVAGLKMVLAEMADAVHLGTSQVTRVEADLPESVSQGTEVEEPEEAQATVGVLTETAEAREALAREALAQETAEAQEALARELVAQETAEAQEALTREPLAQETAEAQEAFSREPLAQETTEEEQEALTRESLTRSPTQEPETHQAFTQSPEPPEPAEAESQRMMTRESSPGPAPKTATENTEESQGSIPPSQDTAAVQESQGPASPDSVESGTIVLFPRPDAESHAANIGDVVEEDKPKGKKKKKKGKGKGKERDQAGPSEGN